MTRDRYYTTKEVLKRVGISRNTLFLWFKNRKVPEVMRDRNGHRIFTSRDIRLIINYKNKIISPKEKLIG